MESFLNNCLVKPVIWQNFDEPLLNLWMIDVFPHLIAYTVIFGGPAQLKAIRDVGILSYSLMITVARCGYIY